MTPRRLERDTVVRRLGEETLILDHGRNRMHQLNETASLIWELCDGSRTVAQLVDLLAGRFGAPPEVVETDVRAVLSELAAQGLIVNG